MPAQKPLVTDAGTTQQLQVGDQLEVYVGTAALPSLTLDGDPNTGIYSPGADQLAISTGGTQRVNVTSSGLTVGAYTLPLTDGTSNQVLQTNGAGVVAWATVSGGGGSGSTVDVPLPTTGLTAGDVCYVSGNNTLTAANATAVGTANALGIVAVVGGAGTGTVRTQGIYANANFVSGLTLAAGQTAYLSKTAGKLTNDVSAYTTGNVYMPVGIITNVTTAGGGNGAADVAINPDLLIVV